MTATTPPERATFNLDDAAVRSGWSDEVHPESHCHRCGGPNVAWCAPSPLWNQVMRGGSINGDDEHDGIVCPTCFAILAEERGVAGMWRLSAQWVDVELETVTPSGRTWDDTAWLWRHAAR